MSGLLRASRKRRVVGEGSGPAAGVGFETGSGSRKRLGAVEVQPDAVATTETAGSASATESASAGCGHADIVDVNVGLVLSLFECEALYLPARAMLDGHPTITPRKRAVLLDWLMELCSEFRFTRATFHLSVNICDRFMSLTTGVLSTCLQLVGVTAVYIASKVEELYPLSISDFAMATAGASSVADIRDMEMFMLATIDFKLGFVSAVQWISVVYYHFSFNFVEAPRAPSEMALEGSIHGGCASSTSVEREGAKPKGRRRCEGGIADGGITGKAGLEGAVCPSGGSATGGARGFGSSPVSGIPAAAAAVVDSCVLVMDGSCFRPRVLACAVLLHVVHGSQYADMKRAVDGVVQGLEGSPSVHAELEACLAWLDSIAHHLPAPTSLPATEEVPDGEPSTLQTYHPGHLTFAKFVIESKQSCGFFTPTGKRQQGISEGTVERGARGGN